MKNITNSEEAGRRKLMELVKKEMENIKIKISLYEDHLTEVVPMTNGLENCTKGTDHLL